MRRIFYILIAGFLAAACVSPPDRPESLWDSAPPAEEGSAKSVPAQIWSGESENPSNDVLSEEEVGVPSQNTEPEITGTVVLNEIYYDAVGSDTDGVVFVELYGTVGLPLSGFRVQFVDGGDGSEDDAVVLPEGARIAEDGFYLIADAKTGAAGTSWVPEADLIDNFDPQNGPDAIQLIDSEGFLLDVVGYGEMTISLSEGGRPLFEGFPAPDVVNGHSLERIEPGLDSNDNSLDFIEKEEPTPRY